MDNNDVLRRVRYILDLEDDKMIATFAAADCRVSRTRLSNWLKRDDDPAFKHIDDKHLAIFLNGLISRIRGKREGEQPAPEDRLDNNIILRKLKIAFDLRDDEILEIVALAGFTLGKSELSAFFRSRGHKNYRACKDQVLRYFLLGLQAKYRDNVLKRVKEAEKQKRQGVKLASGVMVRRKNG